MKILYLNFYALLRLQFLDVETNPGPRRPDLAVCRILCGNVRGLSGKFSDLTVASSQYDILLCSETLVSDMRHVSELLVPGFDRPVFVVPEQGALGRRDGCILRDGYGAFHLPKFECGCCEMVVFGVCGVRQNLYVFGLYRNPDLDDWIFECLPASIAAVQAVDVRASFLLWAI